MSELLIENKQVLTEKQLNDLQWAKEFMEKYEKKHIIKNKDKSERKIL